MLHALHVVRQSAWRSRHGHPTLKLQLLAGASVATRPHLGFSPQQPAQPAVPISPPEYAGSTIVAELPGLSIAALQADKKTPEFLDLQSLVRRLSHELPKNAVRGAPLDHDVVERVSALLQRVRLNPREWRQHAVYRKGRYTRNIVGYSPGQFVALLLCWERGQQSPIHDHSGAHCFIKMLSGQLRDERFALTPTGGAGLDVLDEGTMDATNPEKSVGFMHDSMGLHRISNPSTEEPAVSLHIYSPPFSDCLVFPPTGAEPRRAPMVSVNMPIASERAPPAPEASLRALCTSLSRLSSEADAFSLLAATELSPLEWAMYASQAHFSEFHCVQSVVHLDDRYSVVISCWSPGQGVPPHMVGKGRRTWIKILHGNLQWQLFSPALFPWESDVEKQSLLPEGSVSEMTECSVKLHNFKNASDSEVAVSLMVFSPPLTQFAFQTKQGVERQDLPSLLATSDCSQAVPVLNGAHHPLGPDTPAGTKTRAEAAGHGLRGSWDDSGSLAGLEQTAGRRYLSFQTLAGLLDDEFRRASPSDKSVSALLKRAVFNPEEWRMCLGRSLLGRQWEGHSRRPAAPQRVLLAQRKGFSLLLSFWSQGDVHEERQQRRSGHQGPAKSWTLILEGELEEEIIGQEDGRALHTCVLKEDALSFRANPCHGDGVRLRRRCEADVPCVSLQLYSPAQVTDSTAAP